jgi:hypothetical protein
MINLQTLKKMKEFSDILLARIASKYVASLRETIPECEVSDKNLIYDHVIKMLTGDEIFLQSVQYDPFNMTFFCDGLVAQTTILVKDTNIVYDVELAIRKMSIINFVENVNSIGDYIYININNVRKSKTKEKETNNSTPEKGE